MDKKEIIRKEFLKELVFKMEFLRTCDGDKQMEELKRQKYELLTKEDVFNEFEYEVITVNRFLKSAIEDEEYEYCALLRDYVIILEGSYYDDLQAYYDISEEDIKKAKQIINNI